MILKLSADGTKTLYFGLSGLTGQVFVIFSDFLLTNDSDFVIIETCAGKFCKLFIRKFYHCLSKIGIVNRSNDDCIIPIVVV